MSLSRWLARFQLGAALVASGLTALPGAARAFDIVLTDVAPDRIERQRAFNFGQTLLPGTPDVSKLDERLAAKDVAMGAAVLVRIFKLESQLELWMRHGDRFVLLATYPVCHWSGTLGPKIKEGDKQAPEGFYTVSVKQTRLVGQWRRAFNVGFPNPLDHRLARTGSNILVHGGCSSVGCFAMTNPVMDEIYRLIQAALKGGQDQVPVHIFPFRMTDENLARYKDSPWREGWSDLRSGYDLFESTGVPPHVAICDKRYAVSDGRISSGDVESFEVLQPRPDAAGAMHCVPDASSRVTPGSTGTGATPTMDAVSAATEIVTGSIKPSSDAAPPRMASAADAAIPAAVEVATKRVSPPAPAIAPTAAKSGTSNTPPVLPVRAAPPPPAKAPPAAISGGQPKARVADVPEPRTPLRRSRPKPRSGSAVSDDLSDRPEFMTVRKGSP